MVLEALNRVSRGFRSVPEVSKRVPVALQGIQGASGEILRGLQED